MITVSSSLLYNGFSGAKQKEEMVCLKVLCHELGYCCFRSLRNDCDTLITLCHYPFAICTSPIIHLGSPPPPQHTNKVLHNLCFSFLLLLPILMPNFFGGGGGGGGANKVHYGTSTQNTLYDVQS